MSGPIALLPFRFEDAGSLFTAFVRRVREGVQDKARDEGASVLQTLRADVMHTLEEELKALVSAAIHAPGSVASYAVNARDTLQFHTQQLISPALHDYGADMAWSVEGMLLDHGFTNVAVTYHDGRLPKTDMLVQALYYGHLSVDIYFPDAMDREHMAALRPHLEVEDRFSARFREEGRGYEDAMHLFRGRT